MAFLSPPTTTYAGFRHTCECGVCLLMYVLIWIVFDQLYLSSTFHPNRWQYFSTYHRAFWKLQVFVKLTCNNGSSMCTYRILFCCQFLSFIDWKCRIFAPFLKVKTRMTSKTTSIRKLFKFLSLFIVARLTQYMSMYWYSGLRLVFIRSSLSL